MLINISMKKLIILGSLVLALSGCGTTMPATPVEKDQNSAPVPIVTEQSYTLEQVQSGNTREKCWTIISGNVYDLTTWISEHPGGERMILGICGKDGTAAFEKQHGGQAAVQEILKDFKIGILK